MIKNSEEVKEFLTRHNHPLVVTITTIKDGFVSCVGPVKTICGPELHVSRNTRPELDSLMRCLVT